MPLALIRKLHRGVRCSCTLSLSRFFQKVSGKSSDSSRSRRWIASNSCSHSKSAILKVLCHSHTVSWMCPKNVRLRARSLEGAPEHLILWKQRLEFHPFLTKHASSRWLTALAKSIHNQSLQWNETKSGGYFSGVYWLLNIGVDEVC